MVQFTSNEGMSNDDDRPLHRKLCPLLFTNSVWVSFNVLQNQVPGLGDGAYGLLLFSKKTRKSNRLQMSLQRQYFLPSYLKILGVGPAVAGTSGLSRSRSSNRANWTALSLSLMHTLAD